MKEGFRQCMAWLHTWVGLVMGWLLYFMFVTGTAGYFAYEIDRWMRPELPLVSHADQASPAQAIEQALAHLQRVGAGAEEWNITLPGGREAQHLSVWWRQPAQEGQRFGRFERATLGADGSVREEGQVRATGGGHLLYRMHYALHYVPYDWAIRTVGIATMLMWLAIISGVITHKKIFTDFFTFRPGKGQRSWLDAHNLISVTSLPFFLMITYSGLLFFMYSYVPAGVIGAYGAGEAQREQYFSEMFDNRRSPAAGIGAPLQALAPMVAQAQAQWPHARVAAVQVRHPGDAAAVVTVRTRFEGGRQLAGNLALRFDGVSGAVLDAPPPEGFARVTNDVLFALHEGRFAGVTLRWLYFAAGLLGCGMVATGLVLWTSKRKAKQDKRLKAGQSVEFGYRLVEALNIGAIAGLCTAVAAYFWANRLLPADFAGRRDWEVHALFLVWGLTLLHAGVRLRWAPAMRVWFEQFVLAAAAFALIPLLNLLTTNRHLGVTLPAGDWTLAGFDLTMLALAVGLAYTARKLHRKLQPSNAPARSRVVKTPTQPAQSEAQA